MVLRHSFFTLMPTYTGCHRSRFCLPRYRHMPCKSYWTILDRSHRSNGTSHRKTTWYCSPHKERFSGLYTFTTAICWASFRKKNSRTENGSTFFFGKISLSWRPSHRKQGCWVRIVLIPPSSFLHIKTDWKHRSINSPHSENPFISSSEVLLLKQMKGKPLR